MENVKRLVGWLVFLLAFLVAMSMGLAAVATAQEASTGAESAEDYHRITGFRSARFGMTPDEVRAAIQHDFGVSEDAIVPMFNLEQGTLILGVAVPSLSPGPGPAQIYYIFGASTGRLMYINVVWATSEEPTDQERERVVIAGLQLANYFQRLRWKPEGAVANVSVRPGEVVAFAGVDPDNAGVQVIMLGVPMLDEEGNLVPLEGPSLLQVSYAARFGEPDVTVIEPGSF
ncbi:MAG: hypothetical protein BAA04_10035 [Firmicutes bacterium ZCTH02-B6]|nr:MAG: hypothetical protein BAA04_10035 [Firmicutes bacterium ZCTH02-B6]